MFPPGRGLPPPGQGLPPPGSGAPFYPPSSSALPPPGGFMYPPASAPPFQAPALPPTQTMVQNTQVQCFKCQGRGFVHESNMDHKGHQMTKCFFCQDCPTCHGRKFMQTSQTVQVDAFGRQTVLASHGPQACGTCQGKGWNHDSTMSHKASPGSKCFFCSDCKFCSGKGVL